MIDVLIVGGGISGLSTALVTGRSNLDVLVCQSGATRNAVSDHAHGFFTRDGTSPADLLEIGREQLEQYSHVSIVDQLVTSVERVEGGFRYRLADGTSEVSRTVVLATGVADKLPEVPGVVELWGKRVHVCPYCDGWEYTDQPLATLRNSADGAMFTLFMQQRWSRDMTMLTNGAGTMSAGVLERLSAEGVRVRHEPIVAVEPLTEQGVRVRFADGDDAEFSAIFLEAERRPRSELARSLGCEVSESGHILVDENQLTSVPDVYAVGDIATPRGVRMAPEQVVLAAASGARCAMWLTHDLTFRKGNLWDLMRI